MDSLKNFFREVTTCDIQNDLNGLYLYNGFSLEETSVAFQKRLHSLYEEALMEIPFLGQDAKNSFGDIIERYKGIQSLFDAPDVSCLNSMNREIENGNTNTSLKRERDFVKMICECISLQKYYLNEFAIAIGHTRIENNVYQNTNDETEEQYSADDNVIKGVAGLAEFLGCGINSAQNIIHSKILEEKKIQYKIGKAWRFNRNKLTILLETNPEIFKTLYKK